ncbi:MAG: FAD-dependent monooxygenase [Chitinophagaceae bacterium]|nr:FAD-dependent monooxygenase [Chitinophagaceae bacterium]
MKKKITIIGAGLVGSLLAVLLKKKGFTVDLLERRPDMRKNNISAGKSINLAMSVRGWKALELAGLRRDIEEIAIPMFGRCIHHTDGSTVFQHYGKNNEAIYSVSRGELNRKLMTLAEEAGVNIQFNQRITEVDIDRNEIYLENLDSGLTETRFQNDMIIAADGAFSALRNAYLKRDRFNYHQFYIEYGYKELHISPDDQGNFQLDKNALHIWPRKNFMLIALPNIDGSFTCTLFFPYDGSPSFNSIGNNDEAIHQLFETYFPDVIALMPNYINDFKNNPTASLVTVKCYPWTYSDKSMLIGDAAHAIVPFFGQGMNAGFEDCSTLMELMAEKGDDNWLEILPAYQEARKKNGDAVADLALQNFIEMRDLVADPIFLERKRIEKQIGLLYPQYFNSVYEMVSFSNTPYSYAIHCLKAQDELLANIMAEGAFDVLILQDAFKLKLEEMLKAYKTHVDAV